MWQSQRHHLEIWWIVCWYRQGKNYARCYKLGQAGHVKNYFCFGLLEKVIKIHSGVIALLVLMKTAKKGG